MLNISVTRIFKINSDDCIIENETLFSHKWNRLIKHPHSDDQYTALLGISKSDILDSGTFTCQVEDFGIQQCLSGRVSIKAPPVIKVEPMSLTVRKVIHYSSDKGL